MSSHDPRPRAENRSDRVGPSREIVPAHEPPRGAVRGLAVAPAPVVLLYDGLKAVVVRGFPALGRAADVPATEVASIASTWWTGIGIAATWLLELLRAIGRRVLTAGAGAGAGSGAASSSS